MKYVCPMHPEVTSDKPGKCPKCGMQLVLKGTHSKLSTYKPLIIIISLILLVTFLLTIRDASEETLSLKKSMTYFMAGFFLVFSGFKLLDLKGFAEGYSTYDLLARKLPVYGLIYPFIELSFGLLFVTGFVPPIVNVLVIIVMGFSGIGVLESIMKKRKFQCACLGTIIKVPLSTVTLVEDFGMVAMAILMLVL